MWNFTYKMLIYRRREENNILVGMVVAVSLCIITIFLDGVGLTRS
jgi:hypothetical protein